MARRSGPHPGLLRALDRRLAEAGQDLARAGQTAVVLAAAGSSHPAANAVIAQLAADWQAARGWQAVRPAYASAASPTPEQAVAGLIRGRRAAGAGGQLPARPRAVRGPGRDRSLAAGAAAVSAPLGAAAEVADVLLDRYRRALWHAAPGTAGAASFRPVTCGYRRVMTTVPAARPHVTHQVLNQVPPLAGYDVADDPALLAAAGREGAGWAAARLHELGGLAGAADTQEHARLANEHPPVLRTHDTRGNRIDEVEFHPSWHVLLGTAIRHGLHAAPWAEQRPGAHVARAAAFYVWTQAEAGHGCPVSMTYASVPALRQAPELAGAVRAAAHRAGLPARAAATRREGRAAGGHGDDREAGRLGRPGRHDPRRAGRRQ